MKRKGKSRKSPLPMATPPSPSPSPPKSSVLNKKSKPLASGATATSSGGGVLRSSSPSSYNKTLTSLSDLKDLASSRFEDIKCRLIDRSHSEILKDLEASHSRLHKRFKLQTQTCQQTMDEAEKDFKKMTERISESSEAMKESYADFMAEAQATASRMCKSTIPQLSKSFEKSLGALQSRFGIPSN